MKLSELYDELLRKKGGDSGEAFNETELGRRGQSKALGEVDPAEMVPLNRYAQAVDTPMTGLLAAPYEGLKAVEQKTGIPALSGPGRILNNLGVPVALPNKTTSPANMANVTASLSGALRGLREKLGKMI